MYRFILLWFEPHDCVIYSIINSISFEIRNVILVCELQNFRVLGLARVLEGISYGPGFLQRRRPRSTTNPASYWWILDEPRLPVQRSLP